MARHDKFRAEYAATERHDKLRAEYASYRGAVDSDDYHDAKLPTSALALQDLHQCIARAR